MTELTHDQLVSLAGRWLSNRCGVVLTEYSCWNSHEIADAIGFRPRPYGSILVECKVTRHDFLNDRMKPRNRPWNHPMGNYRYYLTPQGLLAPEDLPQGWGLLYALEGKKLRVRVVKAADLQTDTEIKASEYDILYSLARRAEIRHLIPKLREALP